MYGAQPGYHQGQQWAQVFTHARNPSGPPPAKKPKNNPIITRYAPPPGYKGPAAPPTPYNAPTWQPPHQATYAHGSVAYAGYPPQAYGNQAYRQPTFGQSTLPQGQPSPPYAQSAQQYGQVQYLGYHPNAYAQQTPHPQSSMPIPHQSQWQPPSTTPQSAPTPQQWLSGPPSAYHSLQNSAPVPPSQNGISDSYEDDVDFEALRAAYDGVEMHELETDYFDESYYASHADEVDPKYSLGFLTYHPGLPTKRALPATWSLAELEAIAPRNALPTDDESVSEYFINSKRHEALLSVRQTDDWEEVKDSLIYQEFPEVCENIISMSEMLERYRDRHDDVWADREATVSPEPQAHRIPNHAHEDDAVDGALDANGNGRIIGRRMSVAISESSDVFGNLEQALQANQHGRPDQTQRTRTMSSASTSGRPITRPQPLMPIRDAAQEDLLAALGVTGSPKLVYETPGPALGASQPRRDSSQPRHSRNSSAPGMHDGGRRPPPPPPPPPGRPPEYDHHRSMSYDPWRMDNQSYSNGRRGSSSSHHTAAGSDFGDEDQEMTPRPRVVSNGNKKRSFGETESGPLVDIPEQDENATPRQRYKHPRVDDAYKRRW